MRPVQSAAVLVLVAGGCRGDPRPGSADGTATAAARTAGAAVRPTRPAATEVPVPRSPPGEREGPSEPIVTIQRDGRRIPAAQALRVLHVGDSMAPLVGFYLRPIFWSSGRDYTLLTEDSSSTRSWDNDRKLQEAVYEHRPDLVLISLGSNELFDPTPERRRGAIRRLVADVRGRACLWIGPPAWKKDRGFQRVLRENLGHCRYFDSSAMKLPRMKDGMHPSWTGGYRWAVAVWNRLGGEGAVPRGSHPPVP